MLCDNLEGWEHVGGGRAVQEGGDICRLMAVSHIVQQKPTQHCKAIILHVKKRERERERTKCSCNVAIDNRQREFLCL